MLKKQKTSHPLSSKAVSFFFSHWIINDCQAKDFDADLFRTLSLLSKDFNQLFNYLICKSATLLYNEVRAELRVPTLRKHKRYLKKSKLSTMKNHSHSLGSSDGGCVSDEFSCSYQNGFNIDALAKLLSALMSSEFRDEKKKALAMTKVQRFDLLVPLFSFFFRYAPQAKVDDIDSRAVFKLLEFIVIHKADELLQAGAVNTMLCMVAKRVNIPALQKSMKRDFGAEWMIVQSYFLEWGIDNERVGMVKRFELISFFIEKAIESKQEKNSNCINCLLYTAIVRFERTDFPYQRLDLIIQLLRYSDLCVENLDKDTFGSECLEKLHADIENRKLIAECVS